LTLHELGAEIQKILLIEKSFIQENQDVLSNYMNVLKFQPESSSSFICITAMQTPSHLNQVAEQCNGLAQTDANLEFAKKRK